MRVAVGKVGIAASIVLWSALVAIGAGTLYAYESTPGERGATPVTWPAASTLPHDGTTVAMFVHPECPCTRASITELATSISAKAPGTLLVVVEGDAAAMPTGCASSPPRE